MWRSNHYFLCCVLLGPVLPAVPCNCAGRGTQAVSSNLQHDVMCASDELAHEACLNGSMPVGICHTVCARVCMCVGNFGLRQACILCLRADMLQAQGREDI
jgi:hypothetical protein